MREKSNFLAYIFLLLTVTFWAGNFIVGKFASFYEVPPFSLNFYRWFFAWLILAPFTLPEILKKKEYIFQNYKLFIILGVTSITIFNSIVYYSLNFTQVISGVLMISTIPVMIMFFSFILKIEKTNIFQITGVIFSFLGVIIIITKANFEILKNLDFNKGDITMVVAMFSWALYSTLLKRQKYELSQISLLQVVMTFGLIFLIPIYFIEYQIGFRINLDKPFILILSYVVLLPGLASFILWIKGISMIGANRSGVFLHLMPIFSAIMAMIFFNEKFMFYHILGACFIVTGILLSNRKVQNA
ncbi:DMT family transporter [Candidatus Pelagibacter bacterium nBUS_36]|uniref:DMT family transporter n=1 Tax=Candidatus Pelagibacter bacterium nBUS_36 TaxID=3374194 RepID=UPI003EBB3554